MTSQLDFDQLMQAVALTALLAGFLGAVVWSACGAFVRLTWVLVSRWLVRRRVARSRVLDFPPLGYPAERGVIDPVMVGVVALLTLALLSACSDPPAPSVGDDHGTWLEWVKTHDTGYIR